MPVARDAPNGQWVEPPTASGPAPYFPGSEAELMALRKRLPLNGETAFADTAAAFAALPLEEQAKLEAVRVRRRLNAEDEGWLTPLVRTDPRSGVKSLHSPVWASRLLKAELQERPHRATSGPKTEPDHRRRA